jgi:methylmalonyl-CoA carboxyltransferase large subunit
MVLKKPGSRKAADAGPVADLLARIAELEARIAKLEAARDAGVSSLVTLRPAEPEARGLPAAARPAEAPPQEAAARPEVTEDVLIVISAAVAAFLGERAHVRQVRLVGSEAWAQQGRVSVMASHRWASHRG